MEHQHSKLYELFELAYLNNTGGNVDINKIKPFLDANVTLRVVQKNGHICHSGERCNTVKLIISGEFCVVRNSTAGFSNIIAQNRAPEFCVIKQVLLDSDQNIPEITALKQCVVIEIHASYFIRSLKEDGELAVMIIQNLLRKDESNLKRMHQFICNSTSENVMIYLYKTWLTEHHNRHYEEVAQQSAEVAYELPMNNQLISSTIGVCPRTLVRAIKKLKDERKISVVRRKITLSHAQMKVLQTFYMETNNE